jgi:hypothetical protein
VIRRRLRCRRGRLRRRPFCCRSEAEFRVLGELRRVGWGWFCRVRRRSFVGLEQRVFRGVRRAPGRLSAGFFLGWGVFLAARGSHPWRLRRRGNRRRHLRGPTDRRRDRLAGTCGELRGCLQRVGEAREGSGERRTCRGGSLLHGREEGERIRSDIVAKRRSRRRR